MKKIAISGVTGFLGSRIATHFQQSGWTIVHLLRTDFSESGVAQLAGRLEGCSVVLHLAGAPINRRWSNAYMNRLRVSRITTTRILVQALERVSVKPQLFLCASAVGIYPLQGNCCSEGNCCTEGDFPLSAGPEERLANDDPTAFLQQLCRNWEYEASCCPASIRLVTLRLGVVLGAGGGAFESMRPPLRLGVAAQLGASGEPFSWIHIDDLLAAIAWIVAYDQIRGPVNLVAPEQGTQGEFARALASAFGSFGVVKVPSFALRILYGRAVSVLTRGRRVCPAVLTDSGFRFACPDTMSVARLLADEVKQVL
ncbi:MAG: TIGR01777 family oxidoreductase [Bacteroidales bacterium]